MGRYSQAGVNTNASLSARQSFEYRLPTRFAQCREWQRVKSPHSGPFCGDLRYVAKNQERRISP